MRHCDSCRSASSRFTARNRTRCNDSRGYSKRRPVNATTFLPPLKFHDGTVFGVSYHIALILPSERFCSFIFLSDNLTPTEEDAVAPCHRSSGGRANVKYPRCGGEEYMVFLIQTFAERRRSGGGGGMPNYESGVSIYVQKFCH